MNKNEKDNENDSNNEESSNVIKKNLALDDDEYIIKIYASKDNTSMVFKLEPDKLQTYYFYEKFDLRDFKQKNSKQFNSDESIQEIFTTLKILIDKYTIELEKNALKIDVIILNKKENIISFSLRKKIISQNRLNQLFVEQIQENKSKLKALKKQATKFDKSIQNQNETINDVNNKIDAINNNISNIINDLNNINSYIRSSLKNDEEASEDDEMIKETSPMINLDSNNNKISNRSSKSFTLENKDKKNDSTFYIKNIGSFQYKNVYLFLIFLNVITLSFITYLLYYFHNIKNEINLEKKREEKLKQKFSLFDFANQLSEEELKILKDYFDYKNVEEQSVKKSSASKGSSNKKGKRSTKNIGTHDINRKIKDPILSSIISSQRQEKKNMNETKATNALKNNMNNKKKERFLMENKTEYFFRSHLLKRSRTKYKIDDIKLLLKFKSKSDDKNTFFNKCRTISENLIILMSKEGQRIGFFSKNIIELENNKSQELFFNDDDFVGFMFYHNEIKEMNTKEYRDLYNIFISIIEDLFTFLNIQSYLIQSEDKNVLEQVTNFRKKYFKEIDEFEIYQIKYYS